MLSLIIFFIVMALCSGDDEMEKFKSECMKENSLTEKDMKMYQSIDEIPENILCYSKCLNTKTGLIGENGKIDVKKIDKIYGVDKLDDEKVKKLTECVVEIGSVKECADMKAIQTCFSKVLA